MEELPQEAQAWLRFANNGDTLGAFNLGKYYTEVENYEDAKKWLGFAANKGHLGGIFKLGELHLKLNETDEAKNWLSKAAEMGHKKAKQLIETIK